VQEDPSARVLPGLKPVCRLEEVLAARRQAEGTFCDPRLLRAAVGIVASTRRHRGIELGCSPRASLMLVRAVRAYALVHQRDYCVDQDLVELAPLVLAHRIRLKDLRVDAASLVREISLHELSRLAY